MVRVARISGNLFEALDKSGVIAATAKGNAMNKSNIEMPSQ